MAESMDPFLISRRAPQVQVLVAIRVSRIRMLTRRTDNAISESAANNAREWQLWATM